ncbi:hypothetical protein LPJ66_008980 [Kickxella alabastrina]|uniref:Uncharacterized protein n=1 Tax=Kickxella alabastrina TaxID=61397 RepID=A0ACC1I6S9_9FUNG|nr:hypothetical protein LPJ66_008980 [Kickxella alabastrina]
MAADFIAANASVAIDTVVSMACLVAMFNAKSTRRKALPTPAFPLIALGIVNVTLVTQSAFISSVVFTASLSAVVSLTAYSAFCHYLGTASGNNALACLYMVRLYRLGQLPLIMSLPATAASAAIHIWHAWYALNSQLKSNILFHLKGMCALDGFVFARLACSGGLSIEELRNRKFESEFSKHSKRAVFDPLQRQAF